MCVILFRIWPPAKSLHDRGSAAPLVNTYIILKHQIDIFRSGRWICCSISIHGGKTTIV